jgi:hypothetical protein
VVIGETIVGANVLEERHRAPRCQQGGHTEDDPTLLRTQSLRGWPHRTERLSGARRHATRYMPHGTHMAARR